MERTVSGIEINSPPPFAQQMVGRGQGWGGSWVFSTSQNFLNNRHDALDICQNIVVPKSEHAIPARLEKLGSPCIGEHLPTLGMTLAVKLDDEPALVTAEINKIATDRRLPAKMRAFKPSFAKMPPELLFGRRQDPTQLPRQRHALVLLALPSPAIPPHAPHP